MVIGEDDEPIAVLLRDAVNDDPGYQSVVVPDGALLLDTVRQVHADLLILDIMMPGLNGFEIYDKVREDPEIRDMPVLFVIEDNGLSVSTDTAEAWGGICRSRMFDLAFSKKVISYRYNLTRPHVGIGKHVAF